MTQTNTGQDTHQADAGSMAGRVALVTGGGGGLGRAVCLELTRCGAHAVAADVDEGRAKATEQAVAEAGLPGGAEGVRLDITDRVAVDELVARLGEQHGAAFDCLVSNAGTDRGSDLVDVDDQQWHDVYAVNVHGPMYLSRAFVKHLTAQGPGERPGDIVSVVSISALTVGAGAGAYNSSKAAMLKLAEVMQTEAREREWPARVSVLNPAAMDTPMMEQWGLPPEKMMDPAVVAGLVRTAVTLPPDVVLQSAVVTKRNEYYPR